MHAPLTHRPLPEHLEKQTRSEQSLPVHQWLHLHSPVVGWHVPCWEQPLGHAMTLQSSPDRPAAHMHCPSTHVPAAEHPPGQSCTSHASPAHPSWQRHVVPAQVPWPEQSPGHPRTEQSVPAQPALHMHLHVAMS